MNTVVGDMNMPEPIIVPIIIPTAFIKVILRLSIILPSSSLLFLLLSSNSILLAELFFFAIFNYTNIIINITQNKWNVFTRYKTKIRC